MGFLYLFKHFVGTSQVFIYSSLRRIRKDLEKSSSYFWASMKEDLHFFRQFKSPLEWPFKRQWGYFSALEKRRIVERRTGKGSWMRKLVQLGLCGAGRGGGEFITLFEILSNSVRTSERSCTNKVQNSSLSLGEVCVLYYHKRKFRRDFSIIMHNASI